MKVDSQAKVANLNADELDGVDASAFLGKTEKAADSDKLDNKDSTDFARATGDGTGRAADSDLLDGQDASAFLAANGKAQDADKLDGKDFNDFGAAQVISAQGPLPVEGAYTSKGGTLFILASGSGFRNTNTVGRMALIIKFDGGTSLSSPWVYTNERNSHKTFVDSYVVLPNVPAGQHKIRLQAFSSPECGTPSETHQSFCTATDAEDIFRVAVLEIPA
jgi:hypothetical protein